MKEKTRILAMIFVALAMVSTAMGEIIYVDVDATGANDGSSWTNAYNFLQDALADANSAAKPIEILVAQGIYTPDSNSADPNGSGDRAATFKLINGVTLQGGYAGFGAPDPNKRDIEIYETILSGDLDGNDVEVNDPCDLLTEPSRAENSYHVVTGSNTDSNAVLDGFIITGGNSNIPQDRGGGMYNESGSPTIIQCSFSRNSASYGGAVYNDESHPTMRGCLFTGNFAFSCGGGMRNRRGSNATLLDCVFIGNLARYGGGIENISDSNATLINCTFSGNSAENYGGGMYNDARVGECNPTLINCTFIGNSADYGGGICNEAYSNVIIKKCMFSDNSADYGGGMFNYYYGGIQIVVNCTFSNNSAVEEGGGLFIPPIPIPSVSSSSTNYDGYSIITNCIFWDNLPEQILNRGSVISVVYSDIQGSWPGTGNIYADPCFADKNNGDYHLKSQGGRWDSNSEVWVQDEVTSPCIDAGDPMNPIGLEPFPNGGRINMGAYGGTIQASKSYFGEPVCETIVAGDINGDCKVNFKDFALMALHWLEDNSPDNCHCIVEDNVKYCIRTDKSVYHLGETVGIFYSITNLGSEPISLGWAPIPPFCYRFVIVDANGGHIWLWSWDMPPIPPVMFALDAYESAEYEIGWDIINDNGTYETGDDFPAGAGNYKISGELLTGSEEDRVRVSVYVNVRE